MIYLFKHVSISIFYDVIDFPLHQAQGGEDQVRIDVLFLSRRLQTSADRRQPQHASYKS